MVVHLAGKSLFDYRKRFDDERVFPSKVEQFRIVLDLVIVDYVLGIYVSRFLFVLPKVLPAALTFRYPLLFELCLGKI